MDQEYAKEIEKIVGGIKCPNDFQCYKSGLEVLCKAKDINLESYLECLENNPQKCIFAIPFGRSFYCSCPIRVYVAKRLGK